MLLWIAASVAIGLDMMGELIDSEVSDMVGSKGAHDGQFTIGGYSLSAGRGRPVATPID